MGVCEGGGWWSWSFFFCGTLPPDHLHQVDIRRVYSGVCNCILSPVLHCQPWKWNLINPDQFLMYKMNWQRFKRRGSHNSNQVNDTRQFLFSEWLSCPAPPYSLPPPYHPLPPTITLHWIYFSFKWMGELRGEQLELKMHVCMRCMLILSLTQSVCMLLSEIFLQNCTGVVLCIYSRAWEWVRRIDDLKENEHKAGKVHKLSSEQKSLTFTLCQLLEVLLFPLSNCNSSVLLMSV